MLYEVITPPPGSRRRVTPPSREARAPWSLRKQGGKQEEIRAVCSVALNLFRQITLYLEPILPRLAERSAKLLGVAARNNFV